LADSIHPKQCRRRAVILWVGVKIAQFAQCFDWRLAFFLSLAGRFTSAAAAQVIAIGPGGRASAKAADTYRPAAVNGQVPVRFECGVRRGADIFKALALGANCVMIGRTTRCGLAAYGAAGAQRLMEPALAQEMRETS
jgi:hypothetical protein